MKYQLVNDNHPKAMRLIEIGVVLGTPASDIKAGDLLMWNYGHTSKVNSIIRETAKTLIISVTETKSQKNFERKLHKNRLVCLLTK